MHIVSTVQNRQNCGMWTFGDVLRAMRRERGMSQERLADLAGFKRDYITKIETGAIGMPQQANLEKLAAAFDVSVAELLHPLGLTAVRESAPLYVLDIDSDDLLQIYERLSEEDRRRLVAIARTLWQLGNDDQQGG